MRIEHNFDLTNHNSYRIESYCNRALFPTSESDFIDIFSNKSTKKIIIGGGNNIIFSKAYYNCDIVIVGQSFSSITLLNDNLLACDAGATTLELSEFALSHSLSGAEIFYDIPSSLGGAVVMNAGASGEEIKDILIKVRYLDLVDMSIKEIKKEDIDYQYRNSIFQLQTDKIVLKVWIKLEAGDKSEIKNKMENIKIENTWESDYIPKECECDHSWLNSNNCNNICNPIKTGCHHFGQENINSGKLQKYMSCGAKFFANNLYAVKYPNLIITMTIDTKNSQNRYLHIFDTNQDKIIFSSKNIFKSPTLAPQSITISLSLNFISGKKYSLPRLSPLSLMTLI